MSAPENPTELRAQWPRWLFRDADLRQRVQGVFNPDDYPPSLEKGVQACADRYRAVHIYAMNTVREVHQYRATRLYETDLAHINESPPPKMGEVQELCCPNIRANVQALVIVLQSLLDVLCQHLLGHRIGQDIEGFCTKDRVIGGNVLGVLRQTMLRAGRPRYEELAHLIMAHKTGWIDDVVYLRDVVVHTGELPNLLGYWIMREAGRVHPYTEADIQDPVLRIGRRVEKLEPYCQQLLLQVELFAADFRDLLFPPRERRAMRVRMRRGW